MVGKRITSTEQLFINGILLGMTPSQAGVHAGKSRAGGRKLAEVKHIRAAVAVGRQAMAKKFLYTRDKAITLLYEAIDMARTLEDTNSFIRAIEVLNKMHGYVAPQVHEVHLSMDMEKRTREIKEMSDEKLIELTSEQWEDVTEDAQDAPELS